MAIDSRTKKSYKRDMITNLITNTVVVVVTP